MSEKTFQHTHRVTYAECTVGNHIYYARYLDLLEAARGEFFRALGVPFLQLQNEDTIFPVIESHLRYKSPARYDDLLNIEIWLTKLQGVRLNFAYCILNQNNVLILEGETFHVCAGLNEKPKRITEALIEQLTQYLREARPELLNVFVTLRNLRGTCPEYENDIIFQLDRCRSLLERRRKSNFCPNFNEDK